MTILKLKTIQCGRFLLILPPIAMLFSVFSCERKEEGSQRLGSSEKEAITQVPLNQIPHPHPPLVDDFRKYQGIATADDVFDLVENPPLPI